MSASWALQQAVFATLSADAAVTALIGSRLFDCVPRGTSFPYLVIGEGVEKDNATASDSGSAHTLDIAIWSRAPGFKECKAIAAAIQVALETVPPNPDGHVLILFAFVSADYARQSDGETLSARLRFTALTEPL